MTSDLMPMANLINPSPSVMQASRVGALIRSKGKKKTKADIERENAPKPKRDRRGLGTSLPPGDM